MSRPKIGKCDGCDRIRPIRRVDVQDGRDLYRCGDCVPWGRGVAAVDHEVISADEDGLIADGGERVDGEISQAHDSDRFKCLGRPNPVASQGTRYRIRRPNEQNGHCLCVRLIHSLLRGDSRLTDQRGDDVEDGAVDQLRSPVTVTKCSSQRFHWLALRQQIRDFADRIAGQHIIFQELDNDFFGAVFRRLLLSFTHSSHSANWIALLKKSVTDFSFCKTNRNLTVEGKRERLGDDVEDGEVSRIHSRDRLLTLYRAKRSASRETSALIRHPVRAMITVSVFASPHPLSRGDSRGH